jgi:hypothetical protein
MSPGKVKVVVRKNLHLDRAGGARLKGPEQ